MSSLGAHTPQGERRSRVPEACSTAAFVVVVGNYLFTLSACTRSWLRHTGSLVVAGQSLSHWTTGRKPYHISFIHSSVTEPLGCFYVLTILNSAAMNNGMYVSFPTRVFISSRYRARISFTHCCDFIISSRCKAWVFVCFFHMLYLLLLFIR